MVEAGKKVLAVIEKIPIFAPISTILLIDSFFNFLRKYSSYKKISLNILVALMGALIILEEFPLFILWGTTKPFVLMNEKPLEMAL
tara:strand:+ start:15 stop:272 length:258 start_codon:yes stop_codon:yes gene_type:complete